MKSRTVFRATILCGAAAWFLASIVFAKPGIVVMRDGTKYTGEVSEKGDQYVITIHGVDSSVLKEQVASVTYTETFDKEFADRLAKLAANDVNGRIALARWAFDQREYSRAREALDSAIALDPNNREAFDLQNTITSQLKLEQNKNISSDARNIPTPPPNPTGVERRLLTPADINVIRQKELQSFDRVNVRMENGVEKRYISFRNLQFNDFNAMKPVDRAIKILSDGDDSMKPDVKILGDPSAIVDYRRVIEPMILSGCAAANCHGGPKGGNLLLYNPVNNDALSYTNFYILMRYSKTVNDAQQNGLFGSKDRKMVDRGQGARSLLAQYALPASISQFDHPTVQGYDFAIRNLDDVRFKQLTNWMDHSLKFIAPDYGIKFDIPRATTAPATQPSK